MEFITQSERETEELGRRLASSLHSGDIIALRGGLGAGKTAFVRGIARGLGVNGRVTSPTYTIVNEYAATLPLFHFDLYRLRGADDLYGIGWDDYSVRGGVLAVEWSEVAGGVIPEYAVIVEITATGETTRRITISGREI